MLKTITAPLILSAVLVAPQSASAEQPLKPTAIVGPVTTAEAEIPVPMETPLAVEVPLPVVPQPTPATQQPTPAAPMPQGFGSSALLNAALAQVGIAQDCTDLVQNSLAALGLTVRRDQGGFDFGVQQLGQFGYPIPASEALPGDIAIIGPDNGGHVWVIANPATGEGVHGGWNGTTHFGSNGVALSAHVVYRLF